MPARKTDLEIWVMVDKDGDYAAADDEDTCLERFDENVGGNGPRRMIKVTLTVPLPVVVEMTGEVPEESVEGATLTAK